jgi:hypothetical protein
MIIVCFGHNGQRVGEGAFIDFRRFVTQRQEPVGDEVLDFQVVRGGGFQLAGAHQDLLVRAYLMTKHNKRVSVRHDKLAMEWRNKRVMAKHNKLERTRNECSA